MIRSNADQDILLIHPPRRHPSGGHRYNLALLAEAGRQHFPLRGWVMQAGRPLPPAALIFWDSLYLPFLAARPRPVGGGAGQGPLHVLLLHWLPSLDPSLCPTRRRALQELEARALARVDGVVATGPGVLEPLRRLAGSLPLFVCEPGVDDGFFSPRQDLDLSAGRVDLVTVANLLPAKGHWELLEALARLRRYPWRWHWAGVAWDRGYVLRLRRRARAHGLEGRIVAHGALPPARVRRLLDRADWFVFPSRFESFGMALSEAAARRVPIVSTRVGAAARWVLPGRTGWLVEPGDPAAFVRVMRCCFESSRPRRVWRDGYRSLPPPPRWERVFQRWRQICLTLLTLDRQGLRA